MRKLLCVLILVCMFAASHTLVAEARQDVYICHWASKTGNWTIYGDVDSIRGEKRNFFVTVYAIGNSKTSRLDYRFITDSNGDIRWYWNNATGGVLDPNVPSLENSIYAFCRHRL